MDGLDGGSSYGTMFGPKKLSVAVMERNQVGGFGIPFQTERARRTRVGNMFSSLRPQRDRQRALNIKGSKLCRD
jgi:hypothetical protein